MCLPLQCAVSPKEAEPAGRLIPVKEIPPRKKQRKNSMGDIAGVESWA